MRLTHDALAAQRLALEHAEAVLLVAHGEGEVRQGDLLLDQGMRADEQVQRAVLRHPEYLAAGGGACAAREEGYGHGSVSALEHGGEPVRVLQGVLRPA